MENIKDYRVKLGASLLVPLTRILVRLRKSLVLLLAR